MGKRIYKMVIHPEDENECPTGELNCDNCEYCKYIGTLGGEYYVDCDY